MKVTSEWDDVMSTYSGADTDRRWVAPLRREGGASHSALFAGKAKPIGWIAVASCLRRAAICSYSRSVSGVTLARDSFNAPSKSAIVTSVESIERRKRDQARTADDVLEVRTRKTVGTVGQTIEIDIRRQRHLLRLDAEDAATAGLVRHADIDEFVESAGTQQRRIDQVGAVGRADHDDRLQLLQPVHLGQDRVDDTLGYLRFAGTSCRARAPANRVRR